MAVVDVESFVKILVDWIIDTDIERSDNPEKLVDYYPIH